MLAWSEAGLHKGLPGLAAAVSRSLRTMAREKQGPKPRTILLLSRYAVLLWQHLVGTWCAARESTHGCGTSGGLSPTSTALVFAGSLASLLQLSARTPADLLLPRYWLHEDTRGRYLHWNITDAAMRGVPLANRFWSLMSI